MAEITLTIHGRSYEVTCDDGQEAHLEDLARYLGARVEQLGQSVGQVDEGRLLVMAALLVADELHNALQEVDGLKALIEERDERNGRAEAATAAAIEACAQRIEDVAARLAKS